MELAEVQTTDLLREIIRRMGDDPDRPGLKDTPSRVMESWREMYQTNWMRKNEERQHLSNMLKLFDEEDSDEMIVCKGIEFYSTCEHHLLPFYGVAHVAYIPGNGKVVGLSKLARLVDFFSGRLQVQERITKQVTRAIQTHVPSIGAACVLEATHLCMCGRGVRKQGSTMVTSSLSGVFRTESSARAEFYSCIRGGNGS